METLQLLSVALGLATLAGINLYLTVFLTGLAVRLDWITLSSQYEPLQILAHPAIITVAGILYFVEFFADKIPWLDSLWDSVHTLLRPVGGTLLAIQVLGESNPVFSVIVAMLAGGMSLVAHGMKAGTRVVVNGSPEPFSNIAVSLVEDAGVVGGLWLLYVNPIVALVLCIVFVGISAWFAPRIFSAVRLKLWLAWRKLNEPANDELPTELSNYLPVDETIALETLTPMGDDRPRVEWAVRCIAGKCKDVPSGRFGWLVGKKSNDLEVYFVSGIGWRSVSKVIDLQGLRIARESKFLTENLVFYRDNFRTTFLFDRPSVHLVQDIVENLERRRSPQTAPEEPALASVE